MQFKKGQLVNAVDFKRRTLRRRVWADDGGAAVLIASEDVYRDLENGLTDVQPVGSPRPDVTPADAS